jgi:hypothetical protein
MVSLRGLVDSRLFLQAKWKNRITQKPKYFMEEVSPKVLGQIPILFKEKSE